MFNLNNMGHSFCYIMKKRDYFKIVIEKNLIKMYLKKIFGIEFKVGEEIL